MAFQIENWGVLSGTGLVPPVLLQDGSVIGAPGWYSYQSQTDDIATIGALNYFLPIINTVSLNDGIFIVGTDATDFFQITTYNDVFPAEIAVTLIGGDADVTGPGASTNNAVVRWNGVLGNELADSDVLIDNANNMTVPGNITTLGNVNIGPTRYCYFANITNTFGVALTAPTATADALYDLPPALPTSNGQVLASTTMGIMSWVTPGITIPQTNIVASPTNVAPNNGYVASGLAGILFEMPTVVPFGSIIMITGNPNAVGGWILQFNAGQTAYIGNRATSNGGTLSSTAATDCITLLCVVANTLFTVTADQGNIAYA